jgi:hypothetical protein
MLCVSMGTFLLLMFLSWVTICEELVSLLKHKNKIISFSQTQQYFIIYCNLLATRFGR